MLTELNPNPSDTERDDIMVSPPPAYEEDGGALRAEMEEMLAKVSDRGRNRKQALGSVKASFESLTQVERSVPSAVLESLVKQVAPGSGTSLAPSLLSKRGPGSGILTTLGEFSEQDEVDGEGLNEALAAATEAKDRLSTIHERILHMIRDKGLHDAVRPISPCRIA